MTSEETAVAAEVPKIRRIARVAQVFTPGAPVDRLAVFTGRFAQVQDIVSAVSQKGRHVGLYGERGVGKTSLANVLAEFFDAPDLPAYQAALVNCHTDSSFASIWMDVYRELGLEGEEPASPEDVRYRLSSLDPPALIVIDELDRVVDDEALTALADTVKTLSDHAVTSTLVLVGVATSIDELIGEHQSIVRPLVQIEMPRMSREELREIVENGCQLLEVRAHPAAVRRIAQLSEGLPHYTHLLSLNAATRVMQDDRSTVTLDDVAAAIPMAIARHTIQSDYLKATRSTRSDNLYPQVLLACALARKNQLGYFSAGSIRGPLARVTGRRIEIPAFARHLKQFLEPSRGAILQREGEPRRYFYRFTDPIMQPFVVLNGLSEDLLSHEDLEALQGADEPED